VYVILDKMNITPNNNPNRILEPDEVTPSPPSSPELFDVQASYAIARESLEDPISITPRPYQNIEQELMGVRSSEQVPASPRAVYQFRPFQGLPSGNPDDVREFLRFQDISIFGNWRPEHFEHYRNMRESEIPNRTIPYVIREQQEREQRNRQRQQVEEEEEEEKKEKPKPRSNIRFMR
jgi:hypothetical protein